MKTVTFHISGDHFRHQPNIYFPKNRIGRKAHGNTFAFTRNDFVTSLVFRREDVKWDRRACLYRVNGIPLDIQLFHFKDWSPDETPKMGWELIKRSCLTSP